MIVQLKEDIEKPHREGKFWHAGTQIDVTDELGKKLLKSGSAVEVRRVRGKAGVHHPLAVGKPREIKPKKETQNPTGSKGKKKG